jgi:hypothetical protein
MVRRSLRGQSRRARLRESRGRQRHEGKSRPESFSHRPEVLRLNGGLPAEGFVYIIKYDAA